MADQLMSLVRELKQLNARKKAGEVLSPDEDKRRKELKRTLKAALEKEKGGGDAKAADGDSESTNISQVGSLGSVSAMSGSGSAPKPVPAPVPKPEPKRAPPTSGGAPPKKNPFAIDAGGLLDSAAKSMEGASEPEEFATASVDDPDLIEDFDAPAPEPAAAPAPQKKDYSAAFKLDASNLFQAAASSEAVAAAAPQAIPGPGGKGAPPPRMQKKLSAGDFEGWLQETSTGGKGMRNSPRVIEEMAAKADEALLENKKRPSATKPEEVAQQLTDILGGSGYTPPEAHLAFEQYYGEYVEGDGLAFVDESAYAVDLQVIDPREVELYRSGLLSDGGEEEPAVVPGGLAFLDDFAALYEQGILPPADQEVQFDVDDPNLLIPGKRKVTVHLLNGQAKRGAIRKLSRDDLGFRLEPQGTGRAEDLTLQQCKAIFVHLPPNGQPRESAGRMLTVTFTDRRSVQGTSDDYQPGVAMFSLIPPATNSRQGQFERIIVNAGAVKQVR